MNEQLKTYEKVSIKKLGGSRVEITGSLAPAAWETYRTKALKHINETISLDGFRKGMIPENILVSKVGESAVLEEMAELALSRAYLNILIDEKMDAVGKPEIRVTKLAPGNSLEFTAITSVVPKIDLPDYKKIAAAQSKKTDSKELEVTDKDVDDAILKIRKGRASHDGHDHDKMTHEEHEKAMEASMPELTDEWVRTLGEFDDIPDFRDKLSEMIRERKLDESKEKARIRIVDALTDATKAELPEIMIESELDRTQAQFSADIERMGVKLDDYLKHAKKTLEDIRKEWRPHAEKKAKLQLILNEIAKAEKIKPDQEEIDDEVSHIVEHYKDADKDRAAVYAETILTNEKVFSFLESVK